MNTTFDFWQNHVTGDRWSQDLSLESPTYLAEISTGRIRKSWKYLRSQLLNAEWCAQTLLVGDTLCQVLSVTARARSQNDLGWVPRVVLVPRKSSFTRWYHVPDVRTLAPPDAKNIILKKTRIFCRLFWLFGFWGYFAFPGTYRVRSELESQGKARTSSFKAIILQLQITKRFPIWLRNHVLSCMMMRGCLFPNS